MPLASDAALCSFTIGEHEEESRDSIDLTHDAVVSQVSNSKATGLIDRSNLSDELIFSNVMNKLKHDTIKEVNIKKPKSDGKKMRGKKSCCLCS